MRINDLLDLSTRMFRARTSRTLLTILGMGVGVSTILFLVGLGFGIERLLLTTITTSDSLSSFDVFPAAENSKVINNDLIAQLTAEQTVEKVVPAYQTTIKAKYNEVITDSQVIVTDPGFLSLDGKKLSQGTDLAPQGVLLSTTFAKIFKQEPGELLGKNLELIPNSSKNQAAQQWETPFKIVGLIDNDEPILYVSRSDWESKFSIAEYSRLKVKCRSADNVEGIKQKTSNQGYATSSVSDVISQANKVFEVTRIILGFFGLIALTVSAIGMFNTMTVTLLERTEEIGIMKSIGASDNAILGMFIFESAIMGFLGGLSGIIMGVVTGKLFNIGVNILAKNFGGSAISLFYFPGWFLLLILLFGGLVGMFTGIIPARRASRIDPLEALRYK